MAEDRSTVVFHTRVRLPAAAADRARELSAVIPQQDVLQESGVQPRQVALPGVHDAARRLLSRVPRGELLDLAAGEGAMSQWAQENGFDVTAAEIDRSQFVACGIPCLTVDLNQPLPMQDESFDVVTALEIIEHLENHYQFVREIARVLRPGGHVILSTPNEHNLQNRWNYFLTGFYGDSRHVIDEHDPEMPLRHINMIPPSQLELVWRRAGLELVDIDISKRRLSTCVWVSFMLPIQRLRYWFKLRRIQDGEALDRTRRVLDLLGDPRMLTGRVVVYHLRKPAPRQPATCMEPPPR